MPLACRLMETCFSATSMDGEGARLFGGRWNSPGAPVVYAAGSLALAMLEVMVHLKEYSVLREDYSFIKLQIPDDLVEFFAPDQLPVE